MIHLEQKIGEALIALTGSIGTGKSTVARMFRDLGAVIIDADVIAHRIIEPEQPGYSAIIAAFGKEILDEKRKIDRKSLREIVFSDEEKRLRINSILHPLIRSEIVRLHRQYRRQQRDRVILHDIPLLFETGLWKQYHTIILAYCSPEVQLQRLMKRESMLKDKAQALIAMQMHIDEKQHRSTHIIDNSYSLEETKRQVESLYHKL